MRILVYSWRDPKHPFAGGAEQVMHEHMKGWVKAGHGVTLFSSRFKGSKKNGNIDGIKVIREGLQYLGVQVCGFIYYLKNKDKFDFVVDQFHGIPFFTPLFVRKPKLAVLQEVAREVWFLSGLPFPTNYIVGVVGYFFEPLIFLFYKNTAFMVGSKSAKEDLHKMGVSKNNVTIVPHGVIVAKPSKIIKRNKMRTVAYLGILAKDKGVEDAIKTFSILAKKGKYIFWIIGKGDEIYKNYLLALCDNLGLINKVKFWGFVGNKKKFELLAKSHVLINPSVREGWGLVNIEANVVGTPVVSYKSAGLIDSVKDGYSGILCNKNTPQNLADCVHRLFRDIKKYKKLQITSETWSEGFSWKKSKKASLSLITRITS